MIRTKIYIVAMALGLLSACNAPIEVRPNEQADVPVDVAQKRDFNLLILPGPYKPELNAERWYAVPLTVYLRPVSAAGAASYQITFDTDTYGYLEIAGDRLFPGDKITLPYAAFKDYRLGVRFVTPIAGAQRVRLTAVSGQQTRQADTSFTIN